MMPTSTPARPSNSPTNPHGLRGLTRRWRYRTGADHDQTAPEPSGELITRLLAARGFTDRADIERFTRPKLSHLHAPRLLPGAERAAERLVDAIRKREPIAIYGDYDVDGITATAILYHTLRAADPNSDIRTYVPHRLDEGYGLNSEAIRQLAREGARVIVSVDCGITAIEPARIAREDGVDLIITDHHNPPSEGDALPDAYAIVHPRLPGSQYPFGELCGAGVAFKLAWQFATTYAGNDRVGGALQQTLLDLLPLVALGTIADVVPLVDENRILTGFGLHGIKQTTFTGLRALLQESGLLGENVDSEAVGFILGPRLNACGRMGHAEEAVRLFTSAAPEEAEKIAANLAKLNRDRQQTERRIFIEAERMAIDRGMTDHNCRIIILANETWHPGVVGIVCSRLVERFGRPAILMQQSSDLCKGSARSIDGYSMSAALASCAELLLTHGGHDMAAGLSLAPDRLDAFTDAMTAHAKSAIDQELLIPSATIDVDADLSELTPETVHGLSGLSPFGRGNPRPTVRLRALRITAPPREIGRNGRHLSLTVTDDASNVRRNLRVVWWNAAEHALNLAAGSRIDLLVHPKLNHWNGRTTVEGEVVDARRLA